MIINGIAFSQPSLPLSTYLKQHNLHIEHIALELNGRIIPKEQLPNLILQQGDMVEIVSFVGGG